MWGEGILQPCFAARWNSILAFTTFALPLFFLPNNLQLLHATSKAFCWRFSLTDCVGDGERGTGKTMTLCHVVHFCARQGWLVLHIPDGKAVSGTHSHHCYRRYRALGQHTENDGSVPPLSSQDFVHQCWQTPHKCSRMRTRDAPTLYILTQNSNCFPLLAAHLWVKNCKELMQSSYNKERLDQPLQASFWLRNFRTTNESFLKEVCRGCQAVGL